MTHLRTPLFIALIALTPFLAETAAAQAALDLNAEGAQLYEAGKWERAVKKFFHAYQADPQNDTIRTNLSNAYQAYAGHLAETGKYDGAIDQLQDAIRYDPTNPRPLVQLGAYFIHEGHVADAIFRLEEAIELAPDDIDAHYLLGEAYYKDNDAAAALEHWEWAIAQDPEIPGLAERIENVSREERVEADFAGRNSRHFSVSYDREAAGALVREVLEHLEQAYREVGRVFGRAYPPSPIQVSLYTVEGFTESTQLDEHVGAVYDGTKIRCPVIDAAGTRLPSDELRRRLYHEYVHVVVHHLAKENVPWWLNEGLAEVLSSDLSEAEFDLLRRARKQDALFHLRDLMHSQLDSQEVGALRVAYTQSHATVGFLKKRFGTRNFSNLLGALADGEDPERALRKWFRHNYRTLELAVANYIEEG